MRSLVQNMDYVSIDLYIEEYISKNILVTYSTYSAFTLLDMNEDLTVTEQCDAGCNSNDRTKCNVEIWRWMHSVPKTSHGLPIISEILMF